MNSVWTLQKDLRIKHVVLMLQQELGASAFVIDAPAAVGEEAIRLQHPAAAGVSAYLYTYGQEDERYGVHLEYPAPAETPLSEAVEVCEDIDFDTLAAMLASHFDRLPHG